MIQLGFLKDGSKKKQAPPPRPPPPKVQCQPPAVPKPRVAEASVDLLIDWNSPPASPTPGRSSSDGISLQSFNSDSSGTGAANGGNSILSRSESGFDSEPDMWNETTTTAAAAATQVAIPGKIFVIHTLTYIPVEDVDSLKVWLFFILYKIGFHGNIIELFVSATCRISHYKHKKTRYNFQD